MARREAGCRVGQLVAAPLAAQQAERPGRSAREGAWVGLCVSTCSHSSPRAAAGGAAGGRARGGQVGRPHHVAAVAPRGLQLRRADEVIDGGGHCCCGAVGGLQLQNVALDGGGDDLQGQDGEGLRNKKGREKVGRFSETGECNTRAGAKAVVNANAELHGCAGQLRGVAHLLDLHANLFHAQQ